MNIVPITSAVKFGEIIPPNATVRVIGTTHPLNAVAGSRIDCTCDAGLTLSEMIDEALTLNGKPGAAARRDLIVRVGDYEVPSANWGKVRVKPGNIVTFIPRLQNGGTLRAVLGVAIAIAAIVTSGPLGAAFAGTAFATTIGISASVASSLIAGGIVPAGPIALNALFAKENADG